MTPTLVVGAGGMIGRAVAAALGPRARGALVRWSDAERSRDLAAAVSGLAADPVVARRGWRVVWCAGRTVVRSDATTAEAETRALAEILEAITARMPGGPVGRVVLTSSAGAIHAGGGGPPADEATPSSPRTPYGDEKLAQERMLGDAAAALGFDAVAVRLGPVYGPGQDPAKAQGLVSALCRAVLERRPVRIYVPVETRRPYLWVGDAGRILARIAAAPAGTGGALRVRTVPGGPAITVGQLIGTVRRVTRRAPPVLLAPGPEASSHALDLRLATRHPEETVLPDPTPLTVGIDRLWRALLADPAPRR